MIENIDINEIMARLTERVKASVSPYHTTEYALNELKESGFKELAFDEEWKLEGGGRYVARLYGSSLAAFTIGEGWNGKGFKFAAAHTDFPCIKLKPSSQIIENNYVKCNVDVYGGAILNTWLDRPLSAAGRVVLESDSAIKPVTRLVNLERPLFIIPNLAIHMNRDVNKGVELNRQKDMLPLMCTVPEDGNGDIILSLIASGIGIGEDKILG